MNQRSTAAGTLIRRSLLTGRVASLVVMAVVAVAAALLVAWPRALESLGDNVLADAYAATTPTTRDISAVKVGLETGPATGPATSLDPAAEAVFGKLESSLLKLRASLPAPLIDVVGVPGYRARAEQAVDVSPSAGSDVRFTRLQFAADPHLAERVVLDNGRWPTAVADADGTEDLFASDSTAQIPEIVMATASAHRLSWPVGESRQVNDLGRPVLLVGTYTVANPTDGYWDHAPLGAGPAIDDDINLGITVSVAGYLAPEAFTSTQIVGMGKWFVDIWFPVDFTGTRFAEVSDLAPQLRSFTASRQPIPALVPFSSELVVTLDHVSAQVAATKTVVALVLSGPLAVVGALLAITSRVVLDRRRLMLVTARARGASVLQLRMFLAGEGLILGLPAAAFGAAVGSLIAPGTVSAGQVAGAVVAAFAPAVLLAAASLPSALSQRVDVTVGARRWVWEVVVGVLAVTSAVLAWRRGVADGADPLVQAAPALLALAAAVLALRLAPRPLRAMTDLAASQRGAPAFVGAALAARRTGGRLAPTFGLVVATAVTVLTTVLLTTVQDGTRDFAWQTIGGDLRASGPYFVDEVVAGVDAIEGVDRGVSVMNLGSGTMIIDGARTPVRVYVADLSQLVQVTARGPDRWSAATDVPALVSQSLATDIDGARISVLDADVELDQVATARSIAGVTTTQDWVILDRELADDQFHFRYLPTALLVAVDDGVDPATLVAPVQAVTGAVDVRTQADVIANLGSGPVVDGLRSALLAALAVAVVFGSAALVASEVVASRERQRVLGVLRILGMPRRGAGLITAWEVVTWSVVGLVTGGVLGLLLPQLVAKAVDLAAFTGGTAAPTLSYPPGWLLFIFSGFALFIALCGLLSTVWGSRQAVESARTTE